MRTYDRPSARPTSRFLGAAFAATLMVAVVAACSPAGPAPEPPEPVFTSGQTRTPPNEDRTVLAEVVEFALPFDSVVVVGEGLSTSDGVLTLTFDAPLPERGLWQPAPVLEPDLNFYPRPVGLAQVEVLSVEGAPYGLQLADHAPDGAFTTRQLGERTAAWTYADRAARIEGVFDASEDEVREVDLTLQAGWNLVVRTVTAVPEDGPVRWQVQAFPPESAPVDLEWWRVTPPDLPLPLP